MDNPCDASLDVTFVFPGLVHWKWKTINFIEKPSETICKWWIFHCAGKVVIKLMWIKVILYSTVSSLILEPPSVFVLAMSEPPESRCATLFEIAIMHEQSTSCKMYSSMNHPFVRNIQCKSRFQFGSTTITGGGESGPGPW